MRVIEKLKSRKLVQWAMAYLAGAWALLQVIDLVGSQFGWPVVVMRGITVLIAVGFLAVPVLAWFHGEKGRQYVTGTEVLLLSAVLFMAGFAVSRLESSRPPDAVAGLTDLIVDDARPSIAALPWANRSGLEEDVYFTDGIHDEIITSLSKLAGLRIVSRQSVAQYRGSSRPIGQIASELGVQFVLEGGLLRGSDSVRINVQLIDAKRDAHVWAESYSRPLSLENVLHIETEITSAVATAVSAALSLEERATLGAVPTLSLTAYDFYLRGNDYLSRSWAGFREQSFLNALRMYERAVELDSAFALARVGVANARMWMAGVGWGDVRRHYALADSAIARALEIEPGLPQAHLARAQLHFTEGHEPQAALDELAIAVRGLPNDPEVYAMRSSALSSAGRADEAVADMIHAYRLDPVNPARPAELGRTLRLLRRYDEAEGYLDRAIELAPDEDIARGDRALIALMRNGDIGPYREWIFDASLPHEPWVATHRWTVDFLARDFDAALDGLRSWPDIEYERWYPLLPRTLLEAVTLRVAGRPEAADAFDQARAMLEERIRTRPAADEVHSALGIAYAGLGLKQAALREGRLGTALARSDASPISGRQSLLSLAWIGAMIGEHDVTIAQLDTLLSLPGSTTVQTIRIDPRFDALSSDPAFNGLLARHEAGSGG